MKFCVKEEKTSDSTGGKEKDMTEIRKNVKLTAKDFVTQQLTAYLGSFTRNLGFVLMTALFVFMIYYYKTTNTHYWLMVFSGLPTAL